MSQETTAAAVSNVAARPKFKDKYDHYIGGSWVGVYDNLQVMQLA